MKIINNMINELPVKKIAFTDVTNIEILNLQFGLDERQLQDITTVTPNQICMYGYSLQRSTSVVVRWDRVQDMVGNYHRIPVRTHTEPEPLESVTGFVTQLVNIQQGECGHPFIRIDISNEHIVCYDSLKGHSKYLYFENLCILGEEHLKNYNKLLAKAYREKILVSNYKTTLNKVMDDIIEILLLKNESLLL